MPQEKQIHDKKEDENKMEKVVEKPVEPKEEKVEAVEEESKEGKEPVKKKEVPKKNLFGGNPYTGKNGLPKRPSKK